LEREEFEDTKGAIMIDVFWNLLELKQEKG
jgi:hypothetical protein